MQQTTIFSETLPRDAEDENEVIPIRFFHSFKNAVRRITNDNIPTQEFLDRVQSRHDDIRDLVEANLIEFKENQKIFVLEK